MRFTSIAALSALAGFAAAAPTGSPFPLADGFPAPTPEQLKEISKMAGGSLPNGALPTELTDTATVTLQLIALNELFEVAYFNSLLTNITTNVTGYDLDGYDRDYVTKTITAILNQEQLHALGVNGILKSAGKPTIAPCQYKFPVSDFKSAITLAQTFTDVVLGVLPSAQTVFGTDGGDETPLVNLFGSVIAQEAEQNGWYRSVQKKVASAAPFLTTEGPAFAYTFLQGVIVPGSCPGLEIVSKVVPTFGALTVISTPEDKNSTITYSVPGTVSTTDNALVYLSGPLTPVTVPITNVKSVNGMTEFCADFPFDTGFAKGLTIAAVVKGTGMFANATEVAASTLFGPGIIEID